MNLKPTKNKVMALFLASLALIIVSYLSYNFVGVIYSECGSPFSRGCHSSSSDPSWLQAIMPSPIDSPGCSCGPHFVPHPIYAPLLQIGTLLLIVSIIYFLAYCFKYRKIKKR